MDSDFPHRDRLVPDQYREQNGDWLEEGNTVIVAPSGEILAGPVRQREETLIANLDLGDVLSARRLLDPVGHYHRPDIFRLHVDTSPRPPVVETSAGDAVEFLHRVGGQFQVGGGDVLPQVADRGRAGNQDDGG